MPGAKPPQIAAVYIGKGSCPRFAGTSLNHGRHFGCAAHVGVHLARPGEKVKLKKWPTRITPFYKSKEHYQEIHGEHVGEMSKQ
jgi:hypothetical protein